MIRDIGGIGIYGVISICLFFTVFSGTLLWACLQKTSLVKAMSSLPLEEDAAVAAPNKEIRHE